MLVLEKEKYEEYLEYDQEKQQIKFVEEKERMEELEPFRTEENIFDTQKYFFTFMEQQLSIPHAKHAWAENFSNHTLKDVITNLDALSPLTTSTAVSYTHLTLPTICSV